jgi:hypothetical protein
MTASQPTDAADKLNDVLALADTWDGGAATGSAHIIRCQVHPCPRCILAEAAIDLREVVSREQPNAESCAHDWVKMPNIKWRACVICGAEDPVNR